MGRYEKTRYFVVKQQVFEEEISVRKMVCLKYPAPVLSVDRISILNNFCLPSFLPMMLLFDVLAAMP